MHKTKSSRSSGGPAEKQRDRHELFRANTRGTSDEFRSDVERLWSSTQESARLAIASTPDAKKALVLQAHVNELARQVTPLIRESAVLRYEFGKPVHQTNIDQWLTWILTDVGTDLACSLIPGAEAWRFKSGEPLEGLRVTFEYMQKIAETPSLLNALEEMTYALHEQEASFYLALVRGWVQISCAGWDIVATEFFQWRAPGWCRIDDGAGWPPDSKCSAEDTEALLIDVASRVRTAIEIGVEEAKARTIRIAKSSPDAKKSAVRLPAKSLDASEYFDAANLTDLQRECLSLHWEYRQTITMIARRMDRDRKTVSEHIDAAMRKIDRNTQFQRSLKKSGSVIKPH